MFSLHLKVKIEQNEKKTNDSFVSDLQILKDL